MKSPLCRWRTTAWSGNCSATRSRWPCPPRLGPRTLQRTWTRRTTTRTTTTTNGAYPRNRASQSRNTCEEPLIKPQGTTNFYPSQTVGIVYAYQQLFADGPLILASQLISKLFQVNRWRVSCPFNLFISILFLHSSILLCYEYLSILNFKNPNKSV